MKQMLIVLIFTFTNCLWAGSYPQSWFKAVDRKDAFSWEILPQDAQKGSVILSKRTALKVFSNFTPSPFILDGKTYASVEGFWQSLKFPDKKLQNDIRVKLKWPDLRQTVENQSSVVAKKYGDLAAKLMKKHKINWVSYQGQKMTYRTMKKAQHYQLIKRAMLAKMNQNKGTKKLLMETCGLQLIADHTQKAPVPPAWQYFQIWMDIRDKIGCAKN